MQDIDRSGSTEFSSKIQAIVVDVSDDHIPSTYVPTNRGGHATDGARPRDQNIFTENGKRQCRVNRIAQGIEYGCEAVGYLRGDRPEVVGGHPDEVGEAPVAVDADYLDVAADVAPAGAAETASPAGDMPLAAHALTDLEVSDGLAHRLDAPDELVAHHEGRFYPFGAPVVPAVDVEVGAADSHSADLDEGFVGGDLGHGVSAEGQPRARAFLDYRPHRLVQ